MVAVTHRPITLSDGANAMRSVRLPAGRYPLCRTQNPRAHLGALHDAPWWCLNDTSIGMAGGAWESMARQWPHILTLEQTDGR